MFAFLELFTPSVLNAQSEATSTGDATELTPPTPTPNTNSPSSAQQDIHTLHVADVDTLALEHLIDEQANRAEAGNSILPPLAFVVGTLAIGGGIVSYTFAPSGVRPLGAAMVGLGIGMLTLGAVAMLTSTPQGDRRTRFRVALERGLDPIEFGRFEGEVRAEVQTMVLLRRASWVLGLGMFVGGGVALAMIAASGIGYTQDILAWSIPIGVMAAGAVGAIGGLIPSQIETDWERYQRGEYREQAPISVSVLPWVSSEIVGASAAGTF